MKLLPDYKKKNQITDKFKIKCVYIYIYNIPELYFFDYIKLKLSYILFKLWIDKTYIFDFTILIDFFNELRVGDIYMYLTVLQLYTVINQYRLFSMLII